MIFKMNIKPTDPHNIDKLESILLYLIVNKSKFDFIRDDENGEFTLIEDKVEDLLDLIKEVNDKISIDTKKPEIAYREKIGRRSKEVATKSANTKNSVKLYLEPIDEYAETILSVKQDPHLSSEKKRVKILKKKTKLSRSEIKCIIDIYKANILIASVTTSHQFDRTRSYIIKAFRDWINECILTKNQAMGIKCIIINLTLDNNPRYTQYGQIAGMFYSALSVAFMDSNPHLFEPILKLEIKVPKNNNGTTINIIESNRGKILKTEEVKGRSRIVGIIPAVNLGLIKEEVDRLARGHRKLHYNFLRYEIVPKNEEKNLIREIRNQKRLPPWGTPTEKDRFLKPIKHLEKAEEVFNNLIRIMKENKTNKLVFERQYLMEVIDPSFIDLEKSLSGLPILKPELVLFLSRKKVTIKYTEKSVVITFLDFK